MTPPPPARGAAADVAARFRTGDVRALARALTWAEDGDPRAALVLRAALRPGHHPRILGVTGAPGAGKSTLVDRLAVRLAAAGRRVAVVAVDPSSAITGGAILGDRIRMQEGSRVPGVFIRSMATRGHVGGLARATEDAVDLLGAFGFDDIIVETVGVGQDEVDVMEVADVNVLVLVPSTGDDIQAIKAGIMEIADAYVINKADLAGADRLETHLQAMLRLYEDEPRDVPILRTVATRGTGLDDLVAVVDRLGMAREREDDARRCARAERRLTLLLRDRLVASHLSAVGARARLRAAAERVAARTVDAHAAVDGLLAEAGGGASGATVDHVGVAVKATAAALAFWRDALGLAVGHEEDVETEGVHVTMLPVGSARIELLEPLAARGAVHDFLDRRGPGIHHLCLAVADIEATLARLRAAGVQVVGEAPRRGAGGRLVAFLHPKSTGGVLLELSQAPSEASPPSSGDGARHATGAATIAARGAGRPVDR